MSTIENTCGCGCSTMTVVTNASEACSCGCECCAETAKSKDEEIAELQALRESVEKRLAELS
jgi:hypothetical protein